MEDEEENGNDTPKRYAGIDRIYTKSSTDTTHSVPLAKTSREHEVRRFLQRLQEEPIDTPEPRHRPPVLHVYRRKNKRPRLSSCSSTKRASSDSVLLLDSAKRHSSDDCKKKSGINSFKHEFQGLQIDRINKHLQGLVWSRKRERKERKRRHGLNSFKSRWAVNRLYKVDVLKHSRSNSIKKWVQLSLENVDPDVLTGFKCKVFWPLDNDWYVGSIIEYNPDKGEHHIRYEDGDNEWTSLLGQCIKFYVTKEEMKIRNLKCWDPERGLDCDDLIMLASIFYESERLKHGDVVWVKATGHTMWPALVTYGENDRCGHLPRDLREGVVPVCFFGTYNYARADREQIVTLMSGILYSFHLKCHNPSFIKGLEETWRYLKEKKLPCKMTSSQPEDLLGDHHLDSVEDQTTNLDESLLHDENKETDADCNISCLFELGDLRVIRLGKIVSDSEYFHNERCIWPLGYTAMRRFTSVSDPEKVSEYKMEVFRNPRSKMLPLFRVTLDNGLQINGNSPAACWKKIYCLIRKAADKLYNGSIPKGGNVRQRSGSQMFGFCNKKVRMLILGLAMNSPDSKRLPINVGYSRCRYQQRLHQPVHINWKDLDRCNVCNMDEEYASNLFLQCDKCRIMVHARCYGESEPSSGKLWLCNLCQPDGPRPPPHCCLCPVVGGAMKRTTDGRWAHLTCAMWIPETCLLDVKKMEPIYGLDKIHRDRWKLLCSICNVPYGACIQCSNSSCRIAYHPLCARAADLCVELEDEENILHHLYLDEDDDHCIRLLSFCQKHRQSSNKKLVAGRYGHRSTLHCPSYTPAVNCSGCARSEPYDFIGRRGRKEPEALTAASLKRLYIENRPYIVGGYCQNGMPKDFYSTGILFPNCQPIVPHHLEKPNFLSLPEKYEYMKATLRKRLVFGKSAIHGVGVFAKCTHGAGDMIIEYTGELVRPIVADIRENLIYNSLVGAGTYMFRVDDKRVIDATKAGSLAHLINHSCEPNCYSRVISVYGDEHIIIFAKRDIYEWEELTYDYRFFSIDQQLACYCGFPRCRGVVNDTEAEKQVSLIRVPEHELTDWKAEEKSQQ